MFRSACARILLSALTIVVLVSALVMAGDEVSPGKLAVLDLDPAKTKITYSLDGWPHHTQGTFKLKYGRIWIDPLTGKINGTITVDAASGDSGHSVRDERMRSSVLEVDRFPEINFAPRQVLSHGDPQKAFPVKVAGVMLLHGTEHKLTIDALVERDGSDVTVHSNFSVPFVEWGLQDPSILMFKVAKSVDIDLITEANLNWMPASAMSTRGASAP